MKKLVRSFLLGVVIVLGSTSVYAQEATPADAESNQLKDGVRVESRSDDSEYINIPGKRGRLESNVWRTNSFKRSGNAAKWDYVVSAKYRGKAKVERIRTTWKASTSMRNSASLSLGVSQGGVITASASSSWQTVYTPEKYWENTKGQKISDYKSNVVASPIRDYRYFTITVYNRALVKLKYDKKPYQITAAV